MIFPNTEKKHFNFDFDCDSGSLEFQEKPCLRSTIKFRVPRIDMTELGEETIQKTEAQSTNEKTFLKKRNFGGSSQLFGGVTESKFKDVNSVCRKLNFMESENSSEDEEPLLIRRKSSTSFALTNPKFDEEYITVKTLSVGEQGNVYLCLKQQDHQIYAVKISTDFSTKKDYQNMLNFVNSVNSQKNIFDRFILPYIDFWIESESLHKSFNKFFNSKITNRKVLYIVNLYCQNGNLDDYLNRLELFSFNFPIDFIWDITFEMMCAVHYLHSINYIHFDIKPKNFLVDEHGYIKLIDFCLSRDRDFVLSNMGDLIEGDSRYLSPELFSKNNVDYKSDYFSLGLTLLEIFYDVNLPKNGLIWQQIRTNGIPNECFVENKLNLPSNYLCLIASMTNIDPNLRVNIIDIFNDQTNYPELFKRYTALKDGGYKNTFDPSQWKNFSENTAFDLSAFLNGGKAFAKRSDSTKFCNF